MTPEVLNSLSKELPVLIAGPTASGKSALALEIAESQGGVIVNADSLQVFANWRILTARPSAEEEARAPHLLFGHIPGDQDYSVGHWLREIAPIIRGPKRPIIVGGTGLYFSALTEGLAEIPATPADIRALAMARLAAEEMPKMLAELDEATRSRIDQNNPMRVQRAWEVLQSTGRGLASWQDDTPPPILPLSRAQPLLLDADKDWLRDRIDRRFDLMVANGALDEARANLPSWDSSHPSAKAIGAAELIAHLEGKRDHKDAVEAGKIATRQYAKRQRTWFRSRMRKWRAIPLPY